MKSKEVLKLLGVTRNTLVKYVKDGKIKVTELKNGFYDYDDKSVYDFLGINDRKNVIYARVSTYKQKNDLERQIKFIKKFCQKNNYEFSDIYSDISSGADFDRNDFSKLLNLVLNYKIGVIYISNKDRLTRMSFSTLKQIFAKFGTRIIVSMKKESNDDDELFDELISIMHIFSTKTYSHRRKRKLEIMKSDINLELEGV